MEQLWDTTWHCGPESLVRDGLRLLLKVRSHVLGKGLWQQLDSNVASAIGRDSTAACRTWRAALHCLAMDSLDCLGYRFGAQLSEQLPDRDLGAELETASRSKFQGG